MAEVSIAYCKPCGYADRAAKAAAAIQKRLKLAATLSAGLSLRITLGDLPTGAIV